MGNSDLTTYLLLGAVAVGGYFLWQNGTFDGLLKGKKDEEEVTPPPPAAAAAAGGGPYTQMGVPFIDQANQLAAMKQQQMQQPNLGTVTVGDMNLGTTPLPNFGGQQPQMQQYPGGQLPFAMGGGAMGPSTPPPYPFLPNPMQPPINMNMPPPMYFPPPPPMYIKYKKPKKKGWFDWIFGGRYNHGKHKGWYKNKHHKRSHYAYLESKGGNSLEPILSKSHRNGR